MAKIKLTKTAVESAQHQAKGIELRDTVVPGFLCKITPKGRRVFMLQYRTNSGQPRKPSLGLFGELTVEQRTHHCRAAHRWRTRTSTRPRWSSCSRRTAARPSC